MSAHNRRQPIGTFQAVSGRDVASIERAGRAFIAFNHLDSADGRPLCEVQFTDGWRLLADPIKTSSRDSN